jgi:hypothetical protein
VISALAALDQPVLAALAFVVVGAVCWVVADPARARNLALLIDLLIDVALGGDRRHPPE